MSNPYAKTRPILVVDDNEDDYEAVARAFKKAGLDGPVSLCISGQEALDHLGKEDAEKPALIMLDLNMPGMDGFQVLEKIKGNPKLQQIPVVIWTTSSNEKDIETCYRAGANAYMQKPVIFEQLTEAVKRLKEYWFETAFLPSEKF